MDESAFRQARDAMASRPCAFEKAMLAGACACPLAARRNIAEREAVSCTSPSAHGECALLCALLRQKSAFALKLVRIDAPLPHAKEMKLQCGGLRGVQQALAHGAADLPSAGGPAPEGRELDVHGLVLAAQEKFGDLHNLPFASIIQSVVAYEIRRRRAQR